MSEPCWVVTGSMLDLLEFLVGILDLANIVLAITKYWRLAVSLIACGALLALLCGITDSTPVRWVVGFHVFAACLTAGLYLECCRGELRDK